MLTAEGQALAVLTGWSGYVGTGGGPACPAEQAGAVQRGPLLAPALDEAAERGVEVELATWGFPGAAPLPGAH